MNHADAYAALARLLLPQPGDPEPGALLDAVPDGGRLRPLVPDSLADEHERVFGPSLSSAAPPYETCFGTAHVFMQSQQLADLAGFYRAFGLVPPSAERVDHLAVELEFMHVLTLQEEHARSAGNAEAADVCRQAARRFLADHLGRWTGAFASRLRDADASPFYAALAGAVASLVESECRRLDARPEAVSPNDLRLPAMEADDACGSCTLATNQEG